MDPYEQTKLAQQAAGHFRNYNDYRPVGIIPGGVNAAPKEIGLLQRIEGALTGIEEVRRRIEGLSGRIHGEPGNLSSTDAACRQSGMPAALSQIEGEIRECLNLLARLEDQFG